MTLEWMTPAALAAGRETDRKTAQKIRQWLYVRKRAARRIQKREQLKNNT